MIDYIDLVLAGYGLLQRKPPVPYVLGGMTLQGMDCQGMYEYLLMQCGYPKATVNLRGSNKHWRENIKWRGTPEECMQLFGKIPDGAELYIVALTEHRDYMDGQGDAEHMGLYLDYNKAIHASFSREKVCESDFKGKTIKGGWNMVKLSAWVQYAPEVEAILGNYFAPPTSDLTVPEMSEDAVLQAPGYSAASSFAIVWAANGRPVKARQEASKNCDLYIELPVGTRVQLLSEKKGWTKIRFNGRVWYMMSEFLRGE